jgi:hypothetical protein
MVAQHDEEDMMSQRDVDRTLGRLLTDEDFRDEFFLDPARASLTLGIQLTADELEALYRIPRPMLGSLGALRDDRICRLHNQRSERARQEE